MDDYVDIPVLDVENIMHLLPIGDIDEDLLGRLYQRSLGAKKNIKNKKPHSQMVGDVKKFIKLIDQLRPFLENGFSGEVLFEMMMGSEELIEALSESVGSDCAIDSYDVDENLRAADTALDRLQEMASYAVDALSGRRVRKGRPKATERDVILYELYKYLRGSGFKDYEAKIRAGNIMMIWGLPVPGNGSDDRTATTNITKVINRVKAEAEKRIVLKAKLLAKIKESEDDDIPF